MAAERVNDPTCTRDSMGTMLTVATTPASRVLVDCLLAYPPDSIPHPPNFSTPHAGSRPHTARRPTGLRPALLSCP